MMYLGKNAVGLATKYPMVESGTYTPETDIASSTVSIPHHLGVIPDFVVVMASEINGASSSIKYIANAYFSKQNLSGITNLNGQWEGFYMSTQQNGTSTAWQTYESLSTAKFFDATSFKIPYYNTQDLLKGGTTYSYVVGKYLEEVTPNV